MAINNYSSFLIRQWLFTNDQTATSVTNDSRGQVFYIEHIQSDLTEIKSDVREIKRDARTDFRLLFGAIIFVALGLAGLMARGFHWIGG